MVRPQVLDLDTVITAVEEMLRRTLGEHVELATSLAGDLYPVLADPGQLEQVLVNLAVNARDAMPGGGTLTIDTSNITVDADSIAGGSQSPPGRKCGCGSATPAPACPPRSSSTRSSRSSPPSQTAGEPGWPGHRLRDPHPGRRPHPDLLRTRRRARRSASRCPSPRRPPASADPAPYQRTPSGETVLVVEDEAALREVTRRILARNGYQVITAASGPEALDIARGYQGEIHLLVTDVVMPHMLGKEVAEQMLVIKPEIEVLYMSGYARPVLASQGRLDPGVALVEKPFSEAELLAKAGQVLNGHFPGFKTTRNPG